MPSQTEVSAKSTRSTSNVKNSLSLLLFLMILGIMIVKSNFNKIYSRIEKNEGDAWLIKITKGHKETSVGDFSRIRRPAFLDPPSSNLSHYKEGSTSPSIYSFPRIIIAHACSGSSATIRFAEEIIKAHGYDVLHGGQPFLYKKVMKNLQNISHTRYDEIMEAREDLIKSGMYDDKNEPTITEIVKQLVLNDSKRAQLEGKILLYKANSIKSEIIETLKGLNATMTLTYRENSLDKAICAIRDCFQEDPDKRFGHQVYSNGTKADLCFSRRNSTEPIMAMITNEKRFIKYVAQQDGQNERLISKQYSYFIKDIEDAVSDEDLFSFQYTDSQDTFDRSIDRWMAFLKSFRLNINRDTVKNTLRPHQNTRYAPLHSNVVYNMDTLRSALNGTLYENFLRDDP